MNKLLNIIKKIDKTLFLIEIILKKEHRFLLNVKNNIHILESIIQKKEQLFQIYLILNQEKSYLEEKHSIFSPYANQELSYYALNIAKKSTLLRDLNRKNKILLNKHFYLNQHFLELFKSYKTFITYGSTGDLKLM